MRRIVITIGLLMLPAVALAAGGGDGHGIPWTEIGVHAVNFVLFFTVLGFLTRPMIKDALHQRSATIRQDLEESNRLRREAITRFEELEARLSHFEQEVERMKAEGAEEAEREAAMIAEKTERDLVLLTESTERTIRTETENARRALRAEAVNLAVQVAEESLRAQVTEADQSRLGHELLSTIGQEAANG